MDDTGQLLAKRHITDDAVGYRILLDLFAEYGDTEENPIPVAIEASRGLLVTVLRTGKRQVFAINPMAAARYRDRHSVSRKKSDPGDALVLANILRTDMHAHRPRPTTPISPVPSPSWPAPSRTPPGTANRPPTSSDRSCASTTQRHWQPSSPGKTACADPRLTSSSRPPRHRPGPRAARRSRTQLQAALKRAGRKRGIEAEAERLREVFRAGLGPSAAADRRRAGQADARTPGSA
ncbi:hypothetical protein GCM10010307_38250 [Streptomyces vastus]|uniref:Transposase IS110-like N-terminal domain-containing protein n=1 Tax=Streptomyces vastus TaxID=285451 RepID=A0ABN3QZT0_9ACTN